MNRYNKQIILPQFGELTQQKLAQSKVLVIGAGGLGCPVLLYLAAAGIGVLGIVDGDTVDLSNLQRQVLYTEKDLGLSKAVSAQHHLQKMNSEIQIQAYPEFISKHNVFDLISNYDLVVDCTDNFATRYLVNDVCALYQKPLVYASIFQYEGQLTVFHYGSDARNLRDLFPTIPDPTSVPSCAEAGVIGVLAGVMGTFQANEVIKICTQIGSVLSAKLMMYNSLSAQQQQLGFSKNSGYFIPKSESDIMNEDYDFVCTTTSFIDSKIDLDRLMSEENAVILDVRGYEEVPKVEKYYTRQIPLNQLRLKYTELDTFDTIICLCQKGIRSLQAAELLQEKYANKKIYSVKGGITTIL